MRQSRRIVKLVKVVGVPALAMIAWTAVVGYGVLAGWWHRAIAPAGDAPAFMAAARQMMSSEPHGDLAIALVTKGQVTDEHYIGLVDAVNRETVFPVASMSKWVTAVGVMQLVAKGGSTSTPRWAGISPDGRCRRASSTSTASPRAAS